MRFDRPLGDERPFSQFVWLTRQFHRFTKGAANGDTLSLEAVSNKVVEPALEESTTAATTTESLDGVASAEWIKR